MQHASPRIAPLSPDEFTDEQKKRLGGFSTMSFPRVMMRHPDLDKAFSALLVKVIPGSNLNPRDREILVFRTLELCHEVYELTHHVLIARNAGMTDAEIEAARTGGAGLSAFDQTLVRAAEELVRNQCVSEETWHDLAQRYSQVELMEVVALVGCYVMMAMFTKSYGIELEDEETFNSFAKIRHYT
jgi:alkylhydroperoxidase family enzyme